jgi:23S rRNA (cytosine1962-C5)-methyltransferase
MLIVRLHPKKDVPVAKGHPWIFSGAVDKIQGSPEEGSLCRVIDAKGKFLCQGFYSPYSQIAVRVLSRGKETIDRAFFAERIKRAVQMRKSLIPADTTCFRLVNGEGDLLPGLVVDFFDKVLVMQFLVTGMEEMKADIVSVFQELYPSLAIHERSDVRARSSEGLRPLSGPLAGTLSEGTVQVLEMGIPFMVDVLTGDRTGFYLEHRSNRLKLQQRAAGKDVLDLFSYTGAYAVHALKGGAKSVVSVESSAPALALTKKNLEINKIPPFVWKIVRDDVFRFLQDDRGSYDIIVCDPPAYMKEADDFEKVLGMALERLKPSGQIFATTYLGSQVTPLDFYKAVQQSAEKASRAVRIIEPLYESPDFPIQPSHPQGVHLFGHILYGE